MSRVSQSYISDRLLFTVVLQRRSTGIKVIKHSCFFDLRHTKGFAVPVERATKLRQCSAKKVEGVMMHLLHLNHSSRLNRYR